MKEPPILDPVGAALVEITQNFVAELLAEKATVPQIAASLMTVAHQIVCGAVGTEKAAEWLAEIATRAKA